MNLHNQNEKLKWLREIYDFLHTNSFNCHKFIFRPVNIVCHIIEDFSEKQFSFLDMHFVSYENDFVTNPEYNIYVFYNNKIFSSIKSDLEVQIPIGRYRAFREHTKTEIHVEYAFEEISVFYAAHWGDIYIIKLSDKDFVLLAKNAVNLNEQYVMYIIREIINRAAEDSELLLLHAASLCIEGIPVILTGIKGAGKTTALCYLASYDMVNKIISNDRVFLDFKDDDVEMHYFPLIYRIGLGTVKATPGLKKYLLEKYRSIDREKVYDLLNDTETKTKFSLNSAEFHKIFNNKMIPSEKLSVIVFPRIQKDSDILMCEKISAEKARNILKENCLIPFDDLFIDAWLIKRKKSIEYLEKFAEECIDKLITNFPLIQITYGTNLSSKKVAAFFTEQIKNM